MASIAVKMVDSVAWVAFVVFSAIESRAALPGLRDGFFLCRPDAPALQAAPGYLCDIVSHWAGRRRACDDRRHSSTHLQGARIG